MWATSRATTDTAPPVARVRELNPGWLASVMGTAILAVATYDNPGAVDSLLPTAHLLGIVLAVLAHAPAAVLLAAYLIRWIRHREAAVADLRDPVVGALYGTVPGGLLVLALMTSASAHQFCPSTS